MGLQEVIWLNLQGDHAHATAFACQLSKALLQVALDGGDWTNALLLIPVPDVLEEVKFAGEEQEMIEVHGFRKAIREIDSRGAQLKETPPAGGGKQNGESEAPLSNKEKKRQAWLKKQREKKAAEGKEE